MGVSIDYVTQSQISPETRAAIVAASDEPDSQSWNLCEPICFFDDVPGYENRLFGSSKLNMMPHPDDCAAQNDRSTECNDLEFLLNQLCNYSKKFQVNWVVQVEGSELGVIENGTAEKSLMEAVRAMAQFSSFNDEFGDLT